MFKWIEKGLFVQAKDGSRKIGPLVYIVAALLVIIPSILLFQSDGSPMTKRSKYKAAPPPSIQQPETETAQKQQMPNTLIAERDRELQIAEEQKSGLKPDEYEQRKQEIEEKYKNKNENTRSSAARINFADRMDDFKREPKKEQPLPSPTPEQEVTQGYMTFAERMAAEKKQIKNVTKNKPISFENVKPKDQPKENPDIVEQKKQTMDGKVGQSPTNILPLGTFIPCVLEQDTVSSDLQSHVWVTVATDVTFRRQLQLPLGLVRLRGKTATEATQNMLDIVFDVMVFSDGTELPIQGFAYSAFDIRYPDRYRVRGIPGKMITPPMYTTLISLLLSAGLGASDAFIQNYANQNTNTQSSFTTVPQINPTTGDVTTTLQQTAGQPVNNQIWGTVGMSAAQAGAEKFADIVQKDLDKYKPYVKLEKGTPLFVQLDSTVDVGTRRINGLAIKAEEEMQKRRQGDGTARNGEPDTYPPGDARYRYDGRAQTPSVLNPMASQQGNATNTGVPAQPGPYTQEDAINDKIFSANANVAASNNPQVQAAQQQQMQQSLSNVQQMIQQLQKTRTTTPVSVSP